MSSGLSGVLIRKSVEGEAFSCRVPGVPASSLVADARGEKSEGRGAFMYKMHSHRNPLQSPSFFAKRFANPSRCLVNNQKDSVSTGGQYYD
jgi:hypothetical protein